MAIPYLSEIPIEHVHSMPRTVPPPQIHARSRRVTSGNVLPNRVPRIPLRRYSIPQIRMRRRIVVKAPRHRRVLKSILPRQVFTMVPSCKSQLRIRRQRTTRRCDVQIIAPPPCILLAPTKSRPIHQPPDLLLPRRRLPIPQILRLPRNRPRTNQCQAKAQAQNKRVKPLKEAHRKAHDLPQNNTINTIKQVKS
jgi:hypothetical protein